MREIILSLLLGLLAAGAIQGQAEERVSWWQRSADTPAIPLHQFVRLAEPSETTRALAAWAHWDTAELLASTSTSPSLRAAVLHSERTWTVALWNDSEEKTKVVLEGELPTGVYTVVRLLLTNGVEIATTERRNGLLQPTNGRFQRAEWLEAHTGMLLRFIETTRTVDEKASALRRAVWQSRTSPGVLSRLAALTRETSAHWYRARANIRQRNIPMAARGVHRMLFLVSSIRAVSSTYGGLGEVTRCAENLIDALSELSSALLSVAVIVRHTEQGLYVQVVNAGTQVWNALRLASGSAKDDEMVVLANLKPMERAEVFFRQVKSQLAPLVTLSLLFNGGYARLKVETHVASMKEE